VSYTTNVYVTYHRAVFGSHISTIHYLLCSHNIIHAVAILLYHIISGPLKKFYTFQTSVAIQNFRMSPY